MYSNRIIDNAPVEDDEDDLLFTNKFTNLVSEPNITEKQKTDFRNYYEIRERGRKNANIQEVIDRKSFSRNYTHISKIPENTTKTERKSIIDIDTGNRDKNLYSTQSNFKMELGKTFYSVKQIKLLSTTIPNTDQVITDNPIQIRNNTISWQNDEDKDLGMFLNKSIETVVANSVDIQIQNHGLGSQQRIGVLSVKLSGSTSSPKVDGEWECEIIDENTIRFQFSGGIATTASVNCDTGIPNYTVELTPGNYNVQSIATEIQRQMNLVKRRNGTGVIFHYFTVDVSLDTDVITFRSYITKQLQNNPLSTQAGSGVITVESPSHGFKSGDYVLMIGLKNTGGLGAAILNGLVIVEVLDFNTFTYEVNERASGSSDGGGASCKTGQPSPFRLLFDTADSKIVYNIGFKDEDSGDFIDNTNSLPLQTRTRKVSNITFSGNNLVFTSNSHGFNSGTVFNILSVSTDGHFRLNSDHLMKSSSEIYIHYSSSNPRLNNFYQIKITGPRTFIVKDIVFTQLPSGTGTVIVGGDKIKLNGMRSIPDISKKEFAISSVTQNTFLITVFDGFQSIQTSQMDEIVVCTNKITVTHPHHGFNNITSISASGLTKAIITTKVSHGLVGKKFVGASATSVVLNTVDLVIPSHGLTTSDSIFVSISTTAPNIDGRYNIQVIDTNTVRITVIGGVTTPGICDINKGDTVVLTSTDSVPNVDTNLLGQVTYYIDYISDTQFRIDTGFPITVPGTFGVVGKWNIVSIHSAVATRPGGNTFGGIPLTSINDNYHRIQEIIDDNTYDITVKDFNNISTVGGGSAITVSSEKHGYRSFQANTDTGLETGKLFRSISLEGENFMFLISPNLQTVYSPGNEKIGDIFAKILINQPPGLMLFDSFISAPKVFPDPIAQFKTIEFQMKRKDGYFFNFNNIDYSISLEITEIVEEISGSGVSGRSGF